RKWSVQTKITQWTKTRKSGASAAPSSKGKPKVAVIAKENVPAADPPSNAISGKQMVSKKRKSAACVDSGTEGSDSETIRKRKRQRPCTPSALPPVNELLLPIRRSLRIATQQNHVYCHSPVSICI
ncbi:hypothetical protein IW146_010636, partial [Coemansia sp. RSA 922]